MNAHINLLEMDERRNPGIMLMQKALGTGALVVVVAVVLYGFLSYLLLAEARSRLLRAGEQWARIKPDHESAEEQIAACQELERMQAELAAFSNAQLAASGRLLRLARCVPAGIQLTEVVLSHTLAEDDGAPARRYELEIAGRTPTEGSDACMKSFIQTLQAVPHEEGFGEVKPLGLQIDPRNAHESLFEIRCQLEARRYQ